ncbi:hypothetical protein [Spirabiliibacterium falconis]|uniref:hypothetical protein n=1 Tax=Spirabiliibacterium falconis TaxID=572023 RepID=UPI001AAD3172|nr:hypothetical protein [Spirabiliibacterium falconis]MBE2894681.1 hypothetical protein [Spirabiliibacterium falconis]
MSQQTENKTALLIYALVPIALLISAEGLFYVLRVQLSPSRFFALFGCAVLLAQGILQLIFLKGEICPGQRGRLSNVGLYLGLYWIMVLVLCFFKPFVPQTWQAIAGLLLLFSTFQQPKDPQLRRAILLFGVVAGVIGLLCYVLLLYRLDYMMWLVLSPFNQAIIALGLAYYLLQLSRSRLANFIQLLPMAMLLMLIGNALFCVLMFAWVYATDVPVRLNLGLIALYFALHLLVALLLIRSRIRKKAGEKMQSAVEIASALVMPLLLIGAGM